jgi:hypothetical protein
MSITPGYIFIFKAGLRKETSTYCGLSLNWLAGFCEPALLINEGDPKNREHWVQIITTIPEISSTDHSLPQSFDKRIIP